MRDDKPNAIVDMTFEFSVKVVEYAELLESRKKFVIAGQLAKSWTSIGANTWEAQDAESKADFIHKFKIAAKEVNETKYWLLICTKVKTYPDPGELLKDLENIQRVVSKIISSSKQSFSN